MKKIVKIKIILGLFIFLLFIGVTSFTIKANINVPNWEFIPLGYNYFEDSNFLYTPLTVSSGKIETINYIHVKSNVTYMINFYDYQNGRIDSIDIVGYDSDKSFPHNLTATEQYNGEDKYYTFTSQSSTWYVKINMIVSEEQGANLQLNRVEYNYSMIEGNDYNTYSALTINDLEYKGPNITYSFVEKGKVGNYETNINNPISFSTIKSSIKAMDDIDGDITSKIVTTKDDYSSNTDKVGVHEIIFSVTDKNSNVTTFPVYVKIVDTTPPVITGTNSYTTNQKQKLNLADIKGVLSASDNYDGNLNSSLTLKRDTYSNSYQTPGDYEIVYQVSDSSGNSTEYPIRVSVKYLDDVPPTITGTFTYRIANNQRLSLQEILGNLSAEDNVDGNLTSKIEIDYDYYSYSTNRVGTFSVGVKVADNTNNVTRKEITIVVEDKTSPIFLIDTQVININIVDKSMMINDFVDMLEKTDSIRKNVSYNVLLDEYTENKNTPGTYKVVLDVEGEDLELMINVVEELESNIKPTFLQRIIWFFSDLWGAITSFFKKLF